MATNTSGGTTISFSNTPQGVDDVFANTGLTEDLLGEHFIWVRGITLWFGLRVASRSQ